MQPLRVSLLLFWFRASSKSFYQITKNLNCSFETNKHSNNCLSGRYVTDGADLTENYDSEGLFAIFLLVCNSVFYKMFLKFYYLYPDG